MIFVLIKYLFMNNLLVFTSLWRVWNVAYHSNGIASLQFR